MTDPDLKPLQHVRVRDAVKVEFLEINLLKSREL